MRWTWPGRLQVSRVQAELVSALVPATVLPLAISDSSKVIIIVVVCTAIGIGLFAIVSWLVNRLAGAEQLGSERIESGDLSGHGKHQMKLFRDSVASVSLGAGIKAPDFIPIKNTMPLAYGAALDTMSVKEDMLTFRVQGAPIKRPTIVVTSTFLEGDFTNQEIEAIVGDLIAKLIMNPGQNNKYMAAVRAAEEVGVNPEMLAKVGEEFPDHLLPTLTLAQDTWASRLTGQPEALRTAIVKAHQLLSGRPVEYGFANPLLFVEPEHGLDEQQTGALQQGYYRDPEMNQRVQLALNRDALLKMRIENLALIEQGTRQPYSHIEGSVPVTSPEGWE